MKTLQILGSGCARCEKLTLNTKAAADALRLDYQLEKITQFDRIIQFGVMQTPALVVDGVVKISGRVPDVDAIKLLLQGPA